MGDPGGVGPEVIVKALCDTARRASGRFVIYGSGAAMTEAARVCNIEPFWWRVSSQSDLLENLDAAAPARSVVLIDDDEWALERCKDADSGAGPRFMRRPTKLGGTLSFRWVEAAIAAAKGDKLPSGEPFRGLRANAIVTGPINKQAWAMAGRGRYPGHTELLAHRFGVNRFAMMFDSPALRVVLATVHIPLMDVRDRLTVGSVHDAITMGVEGCRALGVAAPRVAVCGLNPHAGEDGLMGDEEQRLIEPAIMLAREQGIDVRGPFPADTLFHRAISRTHAGPVSGKGEFDLVVAMYHDQGLIPLKLLGFEHAVNITVGLPVVRTSPDHGTAFDIAGKGSADERSMASAIDLAVKMTLGHSRGASRDRLRV